METLPYKLSFGRKLVHVMLAVVLAVGFCPMPALADMADPAADGDNPPVVSPESGDQVTPADEPAQGPAEAPMPGGETPAPAPAPADEGEGEGEPAGEPAPQSDDVVYVAAIGEVGYASLAEAVAAAQDGDTVKLLADHEGTGVFLAEGSKTLTIDLGGHTFKAVNGVGSTGTETQAFHLEKGNTVTIKNGTVTGSAADGIYMIIQNYCNLTVVDVVVDGSQLRSGDYAFSNNCGNVVVDGATVVKAPAGGVAVDTCKFGAYTVPQVSFPATFTGSVQGPVECSGGKLDVKAGSFTEISTVSGYNAGDVAISGGTFAVAPDAQMLAAGLKTVAGADGKFTVVSKYAVAIGDAKYETLAEAVAAAKAGDVITLLADITVTDEKVTYKEEGAVNIPVSVTIDGAGHTITADFSTWGCHVLNVTDGANVVLKDVTIDGNGKSRIGINVFGSQATLDGVVTKNIGGASLLVNGSEVVVTGASALATGSWYYAVGVDSKEGHAAKLTVESGSIGGVYLENGAGEGSEAIFNGGTIAGAGVAAPGTSFTVAGATVETMQAVAKVGNTYYSSLSEAVDAAKSGDTVTLLDNASGKGVFLAAGNKTLTIDLGGYTFTATEGVGSKGTESQAFHLEEGNTVTIKNGTITSTGTTVKMLVQNYCDLTLENVTVDGSNLPGAGRYVTSNNCGNVVLGKDVVIIAKPGDIAVDSCKFGSYAVPTVSIEGATIKGDIELSGGKLAVTAGTLEGEISTVSGYNAGDAVITGGKFAEQPAAEMLAEGLEAVAGADGYYTVAAKAYVAAIGDVKYESLAEAVAAAKDGDVIVMLADVTLTDENVTYVQEGALNIPVSVTIDGAGHTITADFANFACHVLNVTDGANVTIKNVTIDGKDQCRSAINVFGGSTVTLDGVTTKNVGNASVLVNGSEVIVKGDTTLAAGAWYAIDVDSKDGKAAKLTVEAGTIAGLVYVENGAGAGSTAIFNGGEIAAAAAVTPGTSFTVAGATVAEATAVAKVGNTYYGSLAEAIAAVPADKTETTITLLMDATGAGAVVKADQNIVIDFAGHTYTVDVTVGSAGTETNGFQLLQGSTVTMKNGTLKSKTAKLLIQNYCDLTLEGMNLDETDCANVQYVVSNNNGTVAINNSVVKAPEGAVAFDVCSFGSYAGPDVTVTGSTIAGVIELSCAEGDYNLKLRLASGDYTDASIRMEKGGEIAVVTKAAEVEIAAPAGYKWEADTKLVPCDYVAAIGTVKYETLAEAVAAAKDGDVITLLADVTLTDENVTYKEEGALNIPVSVTIDGAGHTITADFAKFACHVLNVTDGANVTIKNVTIDGNNQSWSAVNVFGGSTVTLDGVITKNVDKASLFVNGSTAIVKGDTTLAAGAWYAIDVDSKDGKAAKLTVESGTIAGLVYVENGAGAGSTAIFNGGEIAAAAAVTPGTSFTVAGATVAETTAVAKVGNTYYGSLAEAVAAAESGATVTLLGNASGKGIFLGAGDKQITIDLGGFTFTATEGVGSTGTENQAFHLEKGNTVTIKNGTITADAAGIRFIIQNYSDLTLDGVTLVGTANVTYVLSNNCGDVVVKDSTIKAAPGRVAFDVCGYASYEAVSVTVQNSTIEGIIEISADNVSAHVVDLHLASGDFSAASIRMEAGAEKATITKDAAVAIAAPATYKWEADTTLVPCDYVAAIGTVKYESLAEAVAAAKAGDTITLLTDVTLTDENVTYKEEGALNIPVSVTIDGAGHTITADFAKFACHVLNVTDGATVTIKNVTIDGKDQCRSAINVFGGSTVTLDGVTTENVGNASVLVNGSEVIVKGDTTLAAGAWYAIDVDSKDGKAAKLTVEAGTIAGLVYVENGAGAGSTAIFNGGEIAAAAAVTPGTSFTVAGATVEKTTAVAKVGNTYYGSLAEAVAAVPADGTEVTITLLMDATGNGVVVKAGQNIVFDFAGHTYTVDVTVGSAGTETNGFQLLQGSTVTLKNGALKSATAKILIQNYCDLTIEDMNLDETECANVQYVASNNNGTVVVKNSVIKAPAGAVAFDVCSFDAYAGPQMTVTDTTVAGKIELSTYNGSETISLHLTSGDFAGAEIVFAKDGEKVSVTKEASVEIAAPADYKWENDTTLAPCVYVAAIGTVKYESLAEAVAAAVSGDTIVMLADEKGPGVFLAASAAKDITIDLNGHTFTAVKAVGSTGTVSQAFHLEKGNTVTIKNGTVTSEGAGITMVIQNYSNLTLDGVIVDGTGLVGTGTYAMSNNEGTIAINNSTIIAKDGDVAFDVCSFGTYAGPAVTVNGSTVKGKIELSSYDGKHDISLHLASGDFSAAQIAVSDNGDEVVVTKDEAVEIAIPEGYTWVENTLTKISDCVAKIGDTYFTTLAAAVAAVPADGTETVIELITDATGNGVVVKAGQNIVFDFADHTYTVDVTVGSAGTETNGFQLLQDATVTLKNGALKSTTAKILVQNYSNLTVTNMDLDNSANTQMLYVLSNNNGTVTVENSTIAAPEGKVAMDACGFSSYAGADITVTGSTIVGAIELSSDANQHNVKLHLSEGNYEAAAITVEDGGDTVTVTKDEAVEIAIPEGYTWINNKLTEVVLTATAVTGVAGNTGSMTVKANGTTLTADQKKQGTWTSSDESIVTVAEDGTMTYVAEGVATITFAYAGKTVSADVTVKKALVEYTSTTGKVTYQASLSTFGSNGTYKLLDDVVFTSSYLTTGVLAKDVVLDLNGHTVDMTRTSTTSAILLSRTGQKFAIVGEGTIIDHTADTKSLVGIQATGVTFTVGEGVTLISEKSAGIAVFEKGAGSVVNVAGTVEAAEFGIYVNGAIAAPGATVNVLDTASVTSTESLGIYAAGTGTYTVAGDVTGLTAIYQKGGALTVTGGTIHATGAAAEYAFNGNGAMITGDAIVAEDSAGYNYISTSVTGGVITSDNAASVAAYSEGKTAPTAFVTGGAFGTDVMGEGVLEEGKTLFQGEDGLYRIVDEFTVTFDAANGTEAAEVKVASGAAVAEPTVPVREGYKFLGWFAEGATTAYDFTALVSGDMTLTAQWAQYVAQIGEVSYTSLAEAVAAVPADGAETTITLLVDATGAGVVVKAGQNIVFDFAYHTYTVDVTVGSAGTETNGFQLLQGSTVTLKNGTLKSATAKILVQNYCDLTIENMNLDESLCTNVQYVVSNNNGTVAINNSTVKAPEGAVAFDVCGYASYVGPAVTVAGSTIVGAIELYVDNIRQHEASLHLASGDFAGAYIQMETGADLVTVTKDAAVQIAAPKDYKWENDTTLAPCDYIVKVGDQQFETLAEAVASIPADGTQATITFLKDATGAGVVVKAGQNIVFDLNDTTYTVSTTVGSAGTETNGFQLLQGSTVKFENGTLSSTTAKILVQNYSDLTLENVTVDGSNLPGANCYVVSNNCGNVVLGEGTVVIAKAGDIAVDSCKFGSYPVPTVSVEGATIKGDIELSGGKLAVSAGTVEGEIAAVSGYAAGDAAITGGTFASEPALEMCAPGYIPVKNADGTYTVAPFELSIGTSRSGAAGNTGTALTVKVNGATISEDLKPALVWTSSDESVFTVDENGAFTYVAPGTAIVTATLNGVSATAEVKVLKAVIEFTSPSGKVTYQSSLTGLNSGTYKLLDDVTMTVSRLAASSMAKDVVFDLNGHDLTIHSAAGSSAVLLARSGGTFAFVGEGTVHDDGVGNGAIAISVPDYTLTIGKDVTVLSDNNAGIIVDAKATGAKVVVEGTVIASNFGVYVNGGIAAPGAEVVIADTANITSTDSLGIYAAGTGTYTVAGNVTGKTAIYQKGGALSVTGGNIHATGAAAEYVFNGNGAMITGDAIVAEDSAGYNYISTSVTGGVITSDNAASVAAYASGEGKTAPTAFVTGGAFGTDVMGEGVLEEGKTLFQGEDGLYRIVDEFTVTFDAVNGTEAAEVKVASGAAVAEPTVPVREGYKFLGWFAEGATTAYDFAALVSGDMTLTAQWAQYVAQIGEVSYTSLAEAVAAVPADGTETVIELLTDATGNGVVVKAGQNIVFDFADHTYTVDVTVGSAGTETNGFQLLQGSTVTLKNGALKSTTAKILVQNYSNLTVTNMDLDNSANTQMLYVLSNNNGTVVVENSTIAAPEGKVAMDACGFASYAGADITVTGSTIKGAIELSSDANQHNVSLHLASGNYEAAAITVEAGGDTVAVTKDEAVEIAIPEGYTWVDDTLTKISDCVAKIGDTYFTTLAAAVAAAPADGTETVIELLTDATGNGVVVKAGQNIVFDFADHTYTVDVTVGSAGTETNGFQLLQGSTVTLKNGALKSTTAKILVQNYSNLTVTNMDLDESDAAQMLYVLSNNNGTVVVENSTIAAPEGKVAMDACGFASYAGADITVTGSTIVGAIELSSDVNQHNVSLHLASGNYEAAAITVEDGGDTIAVTKDEAVEIAIPEGYTWVENTLTKLTVIELPEAITGLVYNGTAQAGVAEGEGYTLTDATATDAGTYTATVTPAAGYSWADFTTDPKTVEFEIAKAVYDMSGVTFENATSEWTGEAQSIEITGILPAGVTVSYEGNGASEVGTHTVIAHFAGDAANYEAIEDMTATLEIVSKDASDAVVEVAPATFTGSALEPAVTVTVDGVELTEGTDFDVTYADNTNAGTASYEITFKGDYTGTVTGTFEIAKAVYDMSGVAFENATAEWTGEAQSIEITGTLPAGVTVTYEGNDASEVGTHTVIAHFAGDAANYEAIEDMTATLTIEAKDATDAVVEVAPVTYTGSALEPAVTVTVDGVELVEGTDFDVVYSNNTNAGTASYEITFKGDYTGTVTGTFEIAKAKVVISEAPTVAPLEFGQTLADAAISGGVAVIEGTTTPVPGSFSFVDSTDDVVVGTNSVGIQFTLDDPDNYELVQGEETIVVDVVKAAQDASEAVVEVAPVTYTGSALEPAVTVSLDGKQLTEGTDFDVTYADNTNAGTASYEITFKGDYTGTVTGSFEIAKAVYDMSGVTFTDGNFELDGEAHSLAISGTLPAGVTVSYTGNGQTAEGTYTVTANFAGDAVNYEPIPSMSATMNIARSGYPVRFDVSAISGLGETASVDGNGYPMTVDGNGIATVMLQVTDAKIVTTYTYNSTSTDLHTVYPTHMYVWYLVFDNDAQAYTATPVTDLTDALQYAGSSIRVKDPRGIRMITGVPTALKDTLTGNGITFAGHTWTLEEYGTVIAFDSQMGDVEVTKENTKFQNYAYKRGVADPIFATGNGVVKYTNVLTNFTVEQCAEDLSMRPYMMLTNEDGETIVIYGGIVHRSIAYIAYQNLNAYAAGTDAGDYIRNILEGVAAFGVTF